MTPYSSSITGGIPTDRRVADRRQPSHSRLIGIVSRYGDTIVEAGPDGYPLPPIRHDASHRAAMFDAMRAPKLHAAMQTHRNAVAQPQPIDEPEPPLAYDLTERCLIAVIVATSTGIIMIGVTSLLGWL